MLPAILRNIPAIFRRKPAEPVNEKHLATPDETGGLAELTEPEKPLQVLDVPDRGDGMIHQIQRHTAQKSDFYQDVLDAVRGSTRTRYANALRMFAKDGGTIPCDAAFLANYLRNAKKYRLADGELRQTDTPLSASALNIAVAAVGMAHKIAGHPDPTGDVQVEMALRAIRKTRGSDPERRAKPILKSELVQILGAMNWQGPQADITDIRDAAILLIGWTAALRRSEICRIAYDDLKFTSEGVIITIKSSKNKDGTSYKAIYKGGGAICPVRALQSWLERAGIESGAVFRAFSRDHSPRDSISSRGVAEVIVKRAAEAGLEMSDNFGGMALNISGHSLRAGFVTEMRKARVPDWIIARQTGHVNLKMLDIYAREADLFTDNPSDGVW